MDINKLWHMLTKHTMLTQVPCYSLNFGMAAATFIKIVLSSHALLNKATCGVTLWKIVELAFLSRKRIEIELKIIYKVVEHHRFNTAL